MSFCKPSVPHLRRQVMLTSRTQTHRRLIAKPWHIPSPIPEERHRLAGLKGENSHHRQNHCYFFQHKITPRLLSGVSLRFNVKSRILEALAGCYLPVATCISGPEAKLDLQRRFSSHRSSLPSDPTAALTAVLPPTDHHNMCSGCRRWPMFEMKLTCKSSTSVFGCFFF